MWMMPWLLLFWIALAGGVLWLRTNRRRSTGDSELAALRERLARGQIDAEEFRRHEEILGRTRTSARGGLLAFGVISLIALFVIVPVIGMAASGWDMWDGMWEMHGRGRNTSGSPVMQGGSQATVTIENFAFDPGNLEVPVGATVTWSNLDSAPHDATARNGDWHTQRLHKGESESVYVQAPGEYNYFCSIHPGMQARIVVR